MKFAHMSDCHVGSWRDPKMRELNMRAFSTAIDKSINEKVDFILISGDLFNTAFPGYEGLKEVVLKLKKLHDTDIPVYIIQGSHDYSPTGKTIIDVLENAGLCFNVAKGEIVDGKLKLNFTVDKKTGAKIAGFIGRKGGIEKNYYGQLMKDNLESEQGFKIFMFHSAITEYKPSDMSEMDSQPVSLFPKNFNYYAGGHLHAVFENMEDDYGLIVYPGPLFPNSVKELEKLGCGGFYLVNYDGAKINANYIPVELCKVRSFKIDCNNKTPSEASEEIISHLSAEDFNNAIVILRFFGTLKSGSPVDIPYNDIIKLCYEHGALVVMKHTLNLSGAELEQISTIGQTLEEIESSVVKEHAGQISMTGYDPEKEIRLTHALIETLNLEKEEGETNSEFEKRILNETKMLLDY